MYIGRSPQIGGYHKLDAITTNGSASYTMQLNSANFSPESANHLIVSVNGVIQAPTDSFTVSGSTITFASSLSASDTIDFIMALGNTLDIGTPSDSTVSLSKLTATGTKDATTFLRGDNTFAVPAGGTNTPAFRAYHNTTQTVSNATLTTLSFNSENFDSDGTYDTSNGRFTPAVAGKYFLFANIRNNDTNVFQLELEIRTSEENAIVKFSRGNSAIAGDSFHVFTIADLSATEYAFVTAYHSQGATRTMFGGTGEAFFGGFKLIGA